MRPLLRSGFLLLLTTTLVVPAPPAAGDDPTVSDGDDVRERTALDIRTTGVEHGSTRRFRHWITTYDNFTLADLEPEAGNFGIAIDTDGNLDDLERIIYVFTYRNRLRGAVTNGSGRRLIARTSAEQVGRRTVEVSFERRNLGSSITSYRWFAFALTQGAGRCCFDTAPNRRWVIHDIAKPSASILGLPPPSSVAVPSTSVPLSVEIQDEGGSPDVDWSLRARQDGRGSWIEVASGTGIGIHPTSIDAPEGTIWQLCAVAIDSAGNRSWTTDSVGVPLDDMGFSFSGSWSTAGSDPEDFQGTRHVSSAVGDSFTFDLPASAQTGWIVPPGFDGVGRIFVNGADLGTIQTSATVPRQFIPTFPSTQLPFATNTVEVVVESGTFGIDGFAGYPADHPNPAEGCKL